MAAASLNPARPYHHGGLYETLVEVGVALGQAGGPEAITIREAARQANVSANAAYRHFADLQDLQAEVARRARQRLASDMQQELAALPYQSSPQVRARAQLTATGRGYIRFALGSPHLFRCAWAVCAGPDPAPSAWSLLQTALQACTEAGLLHPNDAQAAAIAAWSLVHGYAEIALRGLLGPLDGNALDDLASQVLDRFVTGVQPPPPTAPQPPVPAPPLTAPRPPSQAPRTAPRTQANQRNPARKRVSLG